VTEMHDVVEIEPGLCILCRHVRVVRSDRGSIFYQCLRSFADPEFPAYPRLPVLHCRGFERAPTNAANHASRPTNLNKTE
jgi:hypothetical protein